MWDPAAGSDSTVVRILVHYEKLSIKPIFLIQVNPMPDKRSLESSLLHKKNENGKSIHATEKINRMIWQIIGEIRVESK